MRQLISILKISANSELLRCQEHAFLLTMLKISLLSSFRVMELTRERLHYIFSQSTYHFEQSDHFFENSNSERKLKLSDILIDLSQYADPRLLQMSLHLLNR